MARILVHGQTRLEPVTALVGGATASRSLPVTPRSAGQGRRALSIFAEMDVRRKYSRHGRLCGGFRPQEHLAFVGGQRNAVHLGLLNDFAYEELSRFRLARKEAHSERSSHMRACRLPPTGPALGSAHHGRREHSTQNDGRAIIISIELFV